MKKSYTLFCILVTLLISVIHSDAQCKLIIEYDEAGNRIFRGHDGQGNADLVVSLTMLPSNINGPSNVYFQVQISEIAGTCALGEILVVFPLDPKLTYSFDPTLINFGPFSLDNPDWEVDETSFPGFHVFKSSVSIAENQSSTFGFLGNYDPQGSSGRAPFTFTILAGSGGDNNPNGNIDSETLYYQSN